MKHSFLIQIDLDDDEPLNAKEIADAILTVAEDIARETGSSVADVEVEYLGSN